MARRQWPLTFKCNALGCTETARYSYETRRDLETSYELKNYSNGRWQCLKHRCPDEVLRPDNKFIRFECVSDQRPHGRYFGPSGFVDGPGFRVFPEDLPVGTRLIVTAEIVLPEDQK